MHSTRWAIAGGASRRQFLQATAGAVVIAAHETFMIDAADSQHGHAEATGASSIAELRLLTSASVGEMQHFYGTLLRLPVTLDAPDRLTIRTGDSRLVFTHEPGAGQPFYHFAFNIPENKILEARTWQLQRTPLLPIPERLRDARFPPDVVDYSHWNAHSVFFLDPGGNVVEYIARHDLRNAAAGAFGPADILCASEIGIVVDDVPATAAILRESLGFPDYRGVSDAFTPLGDERGLLLVFKRGRILDFQPDSQGKAARVFRTEVTLRGAGRGPVRLEGFPYELRSGA